MNRERSCSFISEGTDRVDKAAGAYMPRSAFSLPDTRILVNGKEVKKSCRLKAGDSVEVFYVEECFEELEGEDIPLDVLYEDAEILVIDKPSGMVVHPGAGNFTGTVVNALIYRYGEDFATSEDDEANLLRPGIVHRLDKDTSGVLIIAKTARAHEALARQFAEHSNEKLYLAIVKGYFKEKSGTIESNICRSDKDRKLFMATSDRTRGKHAVTHYEVLRQWEGYAYVRVRIETGRTHQIRVHMQSIGHPVLGDVLYSSKDRRFDEVGLCLHAHSLTIDHPASGERMTFTAPVPERIRAVLEAL